MRKQRGNLCATGAGWIEDGAQEHRACCSIMRAEMDELKNFILLPSPLMQSRPSSCRGSSSSRQTLAPSIILSQWDNHRLE